MRVSSLQLIILCTVHYTLYLHYTQRLLLWLVPYPRERAPTLFCKKFRLDRGLGVYSRMAYFNSNICPPRLNHCTSIPLSSIIINTKQTTKFHYQNPSHYHRSDVEKTLATGKMTAETTSAFITSIKGAILVYKKYPTRRDLEMVAKTIVRKYRFLASPVA